MPRPIYIGVGECECGRVDVKLFHVPNTVLEAKTVCSSCVTQRGYPTSPPRTADDIEIVDGKPAWKPDADTQPYQKEVMAHVGKLGLGHGHFFEVVIGADDKLVGWLHTHPDKRNPDVLCQSFCAVRPFNGAPVHQVVCADPLTLSPSLLCRTCGAHGHVENGRWEPC